MLSRSLAVLAAAVLALAAIACSDSEGYSGVPESVESAIEAIEAGDAQALASRAVFQTIGCTTVDGLGGPRKCQPGQQEGAPVEVLPGAACEGYHIAKGDEPGSFAGFLDGEISLDSAYRTAGNGLFPAGYVLLMTFSNGQFPEHARALFLDDSGATGIFLGCVHTLGQLKADRASGEPVWTP